MMWREEKIEEGDEKKGGERKGGIRENMNN